MPDRRPIPQMQALGLMLKCHEMHEAAVVLYHVTRHPETAAMLDVENREPLQDKSRQVAIDIHTARFWDNFSAMVRSLGLEVIGPERAKPWEQVALELAAPEMLETLQSLLDGYNEDIANGNKLDARGKRFYDEIKRVVAKAEGR
jgi:hypothetical protein